MSTKSAKNKSASSGLDDGGKASGVTPLGLAVAAIIICVLAAFAVPRLMAVSEERARPESPRILSANPSPPLPAVMLDSGAVGWVGGAVLVGQ